MGFTTVNETGMETDVAIDLYVLEDYTQRVIIAVLLLIICVVGITGNVVVILAVVTSRRLRSSTNLFILNLGCSDFLTNLCLPFQTAAMLGKDGWPLPDWVCTGVAAVTLTCVGASITTLALISFNRWFLLTRASYRYHMVFSNRNVALMALLAWSWAFSPVLIPSLAGIGVIGYSNEYKICVQDTSLIPDAYYNVLIATVGAILPASLAIIVFNILIYRFVAHHNREMKAWYGQIKITNDVDASESRNLTCQINVSHSELCSSASNVSMQRQPRDAASELLLTPEQQHKESEEQGKGPSNVISISDDVNSATGADILDNARRPNNCSSTGSPILEETKRVPNSKENVGNVTESGDDASIPDISLTSPDEGNRTRDRSRSPRKLQEGDLGVSVDGPAVSSEQCTPSRSKPDRKSTGFNLNNVTISKRLTILVCVYFVCFLP